MRWRDTQARRRVDRRGGLAALLLGLVGGAVLTTAPSAAKGEARAPCRDGRVALSRMDGFRDPATDAPADGLLERGEPVRVCPDARLGDFVRVEPLDGTGAPAGRPRFVLLPDQAGASYQERVDAAFEWPRAGTLAPRGPAPAAPDEPEVCQWVWEEAEPDAPAWVTRRPIPQDGEVLVWAPGARHAPHRVAPGALTLGPNVNCELAGSTALDLPMQFAWSARLIAGVAFGEGERLAPDTHVQLYATERGWALIGHNGVWGWVPRSTLVVGLSVNGTSRRATTDHRLNTVRHFTAKRPLELLDCDSGAALEGERIPRHAVVVAEDFHTALSHGEPAAGVRSPFGVRAVYLGAVGCLPPDALESSSAAVSARFTVDASPPPRPPPPPPPPPPPLEDGTGEETTVIEKRGHGQERERSPFGLFATSNNYLGNHKREGGVMSTSINAGMTFRFGEWSTRFGGGFAARIGSHAYGFSGLVGLDRALASRLSAVLQVEFQNHLSGSAPMTQIPISLGISLHATDTLHIHIAGALGAARSVRAGWDELAPTREPIWSLVGGVSLGATWMLPL